MKNRLLLAAALILGLSCPALAEIQTFSRASVDVPSGWAAQEEQGSIMLTAPSQETILLIFIDDMNGLDLLHIAQTIATELGTDEINKTNGGYAFLGKDESNEVESMTFVTQKGSELRYNPDRRRSPRNPQDTGFGQEQGQKISPHFGGLT